MQSLYLILACLPATKSNYLGLKFLKENPICTEIELPKSKLGLTGSVRVSESFGKLWKLKIQFSRAWKVVEKRGFFKMAVEKFWISA